VPGDRRIPMLQIMFFTTFPNPHRPEFSALLLELKSHPYQQGAGKPHPSSPCLSLSFSVLGFAVSFFCFFRPFLPLSVPSFLNSSGISLRPHAHSEVALLQFFFVPLLRYGHPVTQDLVEISFFLAASTYLFFSPRFCLLSFACSQDVWTGI